MISDFREIARKSGGLRAGLYRGFLPSIVYDTFHNASIDVHPENSILENLEKAKFALFFASLNAAEVIQNRLMKVEDTHK